MACPRHRLLKTHPKVQELLPEQFASLSLADLKSSADFNQQAYANMLLALNFIVDNLDNPSLLSAHLQRLSNYNNWHVDYVDEQRQLAVSCSRSFCEKLYYSIKFLSDLTRSGNCPHFLQCH